MKWLGLKRPGMGRRGAPTAPAPIPAGGLALRARGVGVERGGRTVLADVDLDVHGGDFVALVGPNGAGKSTLLGALTGDLAASSGVIEVHGRPIGDWSAGELARRRAVLPQRVTVSFPFSVREVVMMGRAPWARTEASALDDERVDASIAAVELTHLRSRPFTTLSGGEQARAALARVFAQDAQLLLLDEPTAALDLHHQELVFELLAQRARGGAAVVTVVHDLALAAAFANRVVLLGDGGVAGEGSPTAVFTPERLGSVYRHEVEVMTHPDDGSLLVLPRRRPGPTDRLLTRRTFDRRSPRG